MRCYFEPLHGRCTVCGYEKFAGGEPECKPTLKGLSAKQLEIKAEADLTKARLTDLNSAYDEIRKHALPDLLEEEGLDGAKVEGVGTVTLMDDMYVSLPASMRGEFNNWLRDTDQESLITEAVHASTLKAFIKECIENGKPYPDNMVKVTPYSYVKITKARK